MKVINVQKFSKSLHLLTIHAAFYFLLKQTTYGNLSVLHFLQWIFKASDSDSSLTDSELLGNIPAVEAP